MNNYEITPKYIEKILANRVPKPLGEYIHAAVMVLIFPINGNLHILFTQRATNLIHQPGDVCFPGGREEGDETPLLTALRETEEEIHIPREAINLLGQADYIVNLGGSIITPFVGLVTDILPSDITFSEDEVAKVFMVPLSFFCRTKPEIHYLHLRPETSQDFPYERIVKGRDYPFASVKIPEFFYEYHGNVIWGITAKIIHNVVTLIKEHYDNQ